MKLLRRAALLLLGLGLLAGTPDPIPASGRMAFRTYGPPEGLQHLSITCLAQDARGYIWAGTEGGAYRFDGSGFRCWSFRDGLPASWVRGFQPLPDGSLWIATYGGLARWRSGAIERLPAEDPLARASIHALLMEPGGDLWVAAEEGLFRRDGGRSVKVGEWSGARPVSLARDGEGRLWVGGEDGRLWGFRKDGILRLGRAEGLPAEPIKAIAEDGAGRLWVRTATALLVRMPGAAAFQRPWSDLPPVQGTIYEESLVPDGVGGLWVPTGRGLLHLPLEGRWRLLDESRGLPTSWANAAFLDKDRTLWVASVGLHRRLGRGDWTNYARLDGLSADNVWGILRDRAGRLWVDTSMGLCRQEGDRFAPVPGTEGLVLYAFAEDREGAVWAGGEQNFLLRLQGGAVQRVALPSMKGLGVVSSLAAEPDGTLWMGTEHEGLHRMFRKGGAWTSERVTPPGLPALSMVGAVKRDAEGRLWVASGQGVFLRTSAGWMKAEGLPEAKINTLTLLPDGSAWVAFREALGILRLKLDGGRLTVVERLTSAEGLLSDSVYSLGTDARGRLWVGTNRGLQRWEGGRGRTFDRFAGLAGQDCNPYSFWADPDGGVWAGTTGGLMRYAPDREGGVPDPPAVELVEVRFGGTPWKGLSDEGAHPYAERTLECRFSCLDFQQEGTLRYQVRLAGLEDGWRETEERHLRYPGLAPGNYRLELRAVGETGQPGPVTSLTFRVRPPWYRTAPAWLLWMLIAGGAIALLFRYRTLRLRKRTEELEGLVHSRTVALEYANIALHAAARTDPLTQLRNRRHLEETLPTDLSRVVRQHRALAEGRLEILGPDACRVFVMLDLDHFKRINDTFGHAAGDAALSQLADVLRHQARESDTVVRWGGEEFLLVAPVEDIEDARGFAERLRKAVEEHPFELGADEVQHLTCSLGFACFPFQSGAVEDENWMDVVDLADRCLYAAKRSGRNGWVGMEASSQAPAGVLPRALQDPPKAEGEGEVRVVASPSLFTPLSW
jgi:diguanylate cyclase (GGDEF)-like protein